MTYGEAGYFQTKNTEIKYSTAIMNSKRNQSNVL